MTSVFHNSSASANGRFAIPKSPAITSLLQCGIDFAGPFSIKDDHGNKLKNYVALFVCMATEAVYIELVSNLKKSDCKLSLKRFIARRGMLFRIMSNKGLNFLGCQSKVKGNARQNRTTKFVD